jgi:putative membrane protein
MYLWIKSFHLIFMVTWFAGLFYLPRLFVYHAATTDLPGIERFKIMERKLFNGIMTPSSILALGCGLWLIYLQGDAWAKAASWLHLKVGLVAVLVAYHFYLGHLVKLFHDDRNHHNQRYYRWINEFPVLVLVAGVLLAVLKPQIW